MMCIRYQIYAEREMMDSSMIMQTTVQLDGMLAASSLTKAVSHKSP